LKGDKIIGFQETNEIIRKIDDTATKNGLDRSNFLRLIVRRALEQGPPSANLAAPLETGDVVAQKSLSGESSNLTEPRQ